jgi:hypothetical protein
MPRRSRGEVTCEVIDLIFSTPPINDSELERRLAKVDPAAARRHLVELLVGGGLGEEDGALWIALFTYVGLGEESESLLGIAKDRGASLFAKSQALAVLVSDDPERMETLLEHFSPEDMAPIAEVSLSSLLSSIQADPDEAQTLAQVLASVPEEMREPFFDQVEGCRRRSGTPAAAAYARALGVPELASLRCRILSAITDEGGATAVDLLENLRNSSDCPHARRAFQGALLRTRTRSIDPSAPTPSLRGQVFLGSCDGEGTFLLLGSFENPDGAFTLSNLFIRAAGDIREGFVQIRRQREEVNAEKRSCEDTLGSSFVEIPLEEAAEIVVRAMERTREMGRPIPIEAQPAVATFTRTIPLHAPRRIGTEELPVVGPEPDLEETRRLLQRPEYQRSWFFDAGDLESCHVPRPRQIGRPGERWFAKAASLLDGPVLGRRLVEMAGHMARWHGWRCEPDAAALCASLAAATGRDFAKSALVRAMLERTLEQNAVSDGGDASPPLGDAELRRHLKARFFAEVRTPRAWDLARLDLTEAAYLALSAAFSTLPCESRPREEERSAAAFAVSLPLTNVLFDRAGADPAGLRRGIAGRLRKTLRLDKSECDQLTERILEPLLGFVGTVCTSCAVACHRGASPEVAEFFFSTDHPMTLAPSRTTGGGRKRRRSRRTVAPSDR